MDTTWQPARQERTYSLLKLLAILFFLTGNSLPASAYCGFEDKTLERPMDFASENPGTLALNLGGKYLVLRRDTCARFASINTSLHFFVNHLNLTANSERAFLAVHAALLNPAELRNVIYLFRNAKIEQNAWDEDKSGQDYSSLHDNSHSEFNADLSNMSREQFDAKYNNGKRKWNDHVSNGDVSYDTWTTRSNFLVRNDLIAASTSGRKWIASPKLFHKLSYRPIQQR